MKPVEAKPVSGAVSVVASRMYHGGLMGGLFFT